MFIPNRTCYIRRKGDYFDLFGRPIWGAPEAIRYALVRYDLKTEDTTVRADSSATRGNSKESVASGRILVPPKVKPKRNDVFVVEGVQFLAKEVEPRFAVTGGLDHYEIDLSKFEDDSGVGD